MPGPFDPARYWRDRLAARPGLAGTGTSFMPEPWQRWLYRAKEHAHMALLRSHGVQLADARVLDFGCGTGFFEDVWHSAGAAEVDGVDIVTDTIARLAAAFPCRRYIAADLSVEPHALDHLPSYHLVTAIDVLYHVVDDAALTRVVHALAGRIAPRGYFLFSDALRDDRPAPHVRFRSLPRWEDLLGLSGLAIVGRAPVAVVHNRPSVFARVLPGVCGAAQYYADRIVAPHLSALANNWAVLARRPP